MTRSKAAPLKNVPASVKARLLALARDQGEEFNSLLTRYVLEHDGLEPHLRQGQGCK